MLTDASHDRCKQLAWFDDEDDDARCTVDDNLSAVTYQLLKLLHFEPPLECDDDSVSITASAFESRIEDLNSQFDADLENPRNDVHCIYATEYVPEPSEAAFV